MKKPEFVHLHVHSAYSFGESIVRVPDLARVTAEMDMKALALTDSANLHAAVKFTRACKEAGIKPIIGMEVFVHPESRFERSKGDVDPTYHLTLLARNEEGYRNLVRISNIGYAEGLDLRPQIDKEVLRDNPGGLIALSGCHYSEVSEAAMNDEADTLKKLADEYREIFGPENFYLEIQDHGRKAERIAVKNILSFAKAASIPVAATNDCRFLRKSDYAAYRVYRRIRDGEGNKPCHRINREFYLKSPEQMVSIFRESPSALRSSLEIAERCEFELIPFESSLPILENGRAKRRVFYPSVTVRDGAAVNWPQLLQQQIRFCGEAMGEEVKGLRDYFRMIKMLCTYPPFVHSKIRGWGKMVAGLSWYFGIITDIYPLDFGLVYELFLLEGQDAIPDIRLHIPEEIQPDFFNYLESHFEMNFKARAFEAGRYQLGKAVSEAAGVLGINKKDEAIVDKCFHYPFRGKLRKALKTDPGLQGKSGKYIRLKKLLRTAALLEKLPLRIPVPQPFSSVWVIAHHRMRDYLPLCPGGNGSLLCQFDSDDLKDLNLPRLFVFSLRPQICLEAALELIYRSAKKAVNKWKIPFDDDRTWKMIGKYQLAGISCFSSPTRKRLARGIGLKKIEHLIILEAIMRNRPWHAWAKFMRNKAAPEEICYLHQKIKEILGETYGVIVYEEQVFQIVREIADFEAYEAVEFVLSLKKSRKEALRFRKTFIERATAKKIKRGDADKIFRKILEEGLNCPSKAFCVCWAALTYRLAYLKAHYPAEFLLASIIAYPENDKHARECLHEVKRMGLQEDINSLVDLLDQKDKQEVLRRIK